tara:strand:+ start:1134 stop:2705 length:1572 start_codon:yes stop_codon:yes gene_type:complete
MGIFSKYQQVENIFLEDEEKKRAVIIRTYGEDKLIKSILYSDRLSNKNYVKNLSNNNQQAVFKILNSSFGFKSLSNITRYVARDLEYQKDEKTLNLYDEYGNPIEDLNKKLKEWNEDFDDYELKESQSWKIKRVNFLEARRDELSYYQEKRELNKKELTELSSINQQLAGGYLIVDNKQTGEKAKVSSKINQGTDFYHLLFSVGGSGHNEKKITHAMKETLSTEFESKGLSYMFVMHNDTDNQHFHVVLKAKNPILQKKVYFDKEDLFAIRQRFANELTKVGIERTSVLRKDNVLTLSKVLKDTERLKSNYETYQKNIKKGTANSIEYKERTIKSIDFIINSLNGKVKLENDLKEFSKSLKDKEKEFAEVLNLYNNETISAKKQQLKHKVEYLEKEWTTLNKVNDRFNEIKSTKKELLEFKASLLTTKDEEFVSTYNSFIKQNKSLHGKIEELQSIESLTGKDRRNTIKKKETKEKLKEHYKQVKKAIRAFEKDSNKSSFAKLAVQQLKELAKTEKRKKEPSK